MPKLMSSRRRFEFTLGISWTLMLEVWPFPLKSAERSVAILLRELVTQVFGKLGSS